MRYRCTPAWLVLLSVIVSGCGCDSGGGGSSGVGSCTPSVDTAFDVSSGQPAPIDTTQHAQTFTTVGGGPLLGVELQLESNTVNTNEKFITVDVRPVGGGGVPLEDDSSAIATAVVDASTLPLGGSAWVSFDLSLGNATLSPATVYAIVVRQTTGATSPESARILASTSPTHPDGVAYTRQIPGTWTAVTSADYAFRVLVCD